MRTIFHALSNEIGLYQGRLCPRRHRALTAGAAEVGVAATRSPGLWHETPHLQPPPTSSHGKGQHWRENESMLSDRQWCTPRMRGMSWSLLQFTLNHKPLWTGIYAGFFTCLWCLFLQANIDCISHSHTNSCVHYQWFFDLIIDSRKSSTFWKLCL